MIMNRKIPPFILHENRRDKNGFRPDDHMYNTDRLHISKEDFTELTDGMKRYWDIKKNNMDKVLFWRFGDWYVLYYDDLTICSKLLDLAITPFPGNP